MTAPVSADASRPPLSFVELVGMVAGLNAVGAFGVDIMLPSLATIGRDLHAADANDSQLVIYVYLLSVGFGQLVYGPLSDSFGRRGVLLFALGIYMAATVGCIFAPTLPILLAARAMQGVSVASTRIVGTAVVRDLVSGREMARVMSLGMTIFLAAPMVAPAIGQVILLFAGWRWTFGVLLVAAAIGMAWIAIRLPETLPSARRPPFNVGEIVRGYVAVSCERLSTGYALASALVFGSLGTFIGTAERILGEIYGLGVLFPAAFALVAGVMSGASFANSALVVKLGMRRLGHTALIAFTAISAVHGLLIVIMNPTPIWLYLPLLCASMVCFGMIGANFSAIAMEPLGARAGTGAAYFGFASVGINAILGALIARQVRDSPAPFVFGQAGLGLLAIVAVLVTERGRLFGQTPK